MAARFPFPPSLSPPSCGFVIPWQTRIFPPAVCRYKPGSFSSEYAPESVRPGDSGRIPSIPRFPPDISHDLSSRRADSVHRRFPSSEHILPDLLEEYAEKSVVSGGKIKVLVLDEWLVSELSKADVEFLLELTERRFDSTSRIFSLYKREDWVKRLRSGTYAESIVERFAHNTIWVETVDVNMRQYLSMPDRLR